MRIGIGAGDPSGAASLEPIIQQIIAAEDDGFDSVWMGQIFGADALTVFALAGARTKRIALGTAVIPTYPRHPYVMAQQAMTVQSAASGRLTLGIGLSHKPVIETMWGISYDKPARHMREYLSVLQPLLQNGKVAFTGETYRVAAPLQVPGAKPLPVIIAALAPMMLRIAGEMTDGTATWMTGVRTIATHVVPKLNAAAEAAGKPRPRTVVGLPVAVTDDPSAAREIAGKIFQMYGQLPNYRRVLDIEGVEGPADVAVVGDEAAVERQIRDLAAAGATDFNAAMFPVGNDHAESYARTRALLKGLVGKV